MNVSAIPLVGLMGHTQPRMEANSNAAGVAKFFGGSALEVPFYSFVDALEWKSSNAPNEELVEWASEWQKLDLGVFTTCRLSEKIGRHRSVASLPAGLYESLQRQKAVGEVAGLFLSDTGKHLLPRDFFRIGVDFDDLKKLADRGGTVLVVGTDGARLATARAALNGRLVSVIVTDVEFARALLAG